MTVTQRLITIAICVLGTMATRFLPFLLFREGKPTPPFIAYLGRALPSAAFAMLVVYCLRGVSLFSGTHAVPELIAIIITAALHRWKHQMPLSIAGGTAAYMLLVQLIF